MPNIKEIQKLKEKIITECHAWSVGYLNEMLDKLLATQQKEWERKERGESLSNLCPYCGKCVQCEHPDWECPMLPPSKGKTK